MSPRQRDQMMGHASDNDGIEEYDNPMPDWWLGMFFFTIVFAIGYSVEYHWISGRSQEGAYIDEMVAATERYKEPDAATAAAGSGASQADPAALRALGEDVYKTNCVACHLAEMTGNIGPNLLDAEWIHGSSLEDVVNTVTNGVADKGMPPWGPILGDKKVRAVSEYILSRNAAAQAGN